MNPLKLSKAKQILEGIKTAEQAVELTGPARKEYLAALDVVHGPVEKRAADIGFDLGKEQFHGTQFKDSQIDSFVPSGERKGDTFKYGKGVYTTPSSGMADQYAGHGEGVIYPVVLKSKNEFHPADLDKAKELLTNADVDTSHRMLRSTEEGLDLLEKKMGKDKVSSFLDANGYRTAVPDDGIYVSKPSDVRSKFAAFDPRFADSPKLLAGAAAIPAMGNQFSNPADIVKAGYQKFEQARQSVVNKIVDLTDMTKDNPHVPQYAKDTYNKAADALVSNATDPLNYVGGAGAADAVIGAGSAAYEAYNSNKPTSTPANTNPVQAVNWKSR